MSSLNQRRKTSLAFETPCLGFELVLRRPIESTAFTRHKQPFVYQAQATICVMLSVSFEQIDRVDD
jgi:hypothetical protein